MRTKEVRLASYGKTFIAGGATKQLQDFLRTQRGGNFSLLSLEGLASVKESDLYREFGQYSPLALVRRVLSHPECSTQVKENIAALIAEIGEETNFWKNNPRSVYNPFQLYTICATMADILKDSEIIYSEESYEGSDVVIYYYASEIFHALAVQMTKLLPPPSRDAMPITTFEWLQLIMNDLYAQRDIDSMNITNNVLTNNISGIVDAAMTPAPAPVVIEEPVNYVTEQDVLPPENDSEAEEERVVIPDKTITDEVLYPERRTRLNIKCSAVMDFMIPLSMPRTQIEAYLPLVQRSIKDPNMCLSLGEDNAVSVVMTIEELMNSSCIDERAAAHSHDLLYDKTLTISKRIKAIEDAFIDLAYKESELTERLNGGVL